MQTINALYRVSQAFITDDMHNAVQVATDVATELTNAAFGAFFYNVENNQGESYMLYTISGVDKEAFSRFPMPRNTAIFSPTFSGDGAVRLDDVTADPRYGKNSPHKGMPEGHLPVRSYLAVPVMAKNGEVLGGLFFGHPKVGVFTETAETIALAIAAQAGIGIESSRLYSKAVEGELQFREMADSINQMIWVTRPDGFHEYYNKRWYEYTGVPEGSTDGEEWNGMFHADDQERAWKRWRYSLATGEPYEIEYRLRRADGQYRWALGRAECVRDAKGNITKWYGTCTDIQELVDARHRAETASIAKSEFLANMSHEIRTPMNAVIGLANILARSEPLTTKQQEFIKTLQLSANGLLGLLNDLLDIAKIEAQTVEMESVPVDIQKLAQEIISVTNVKAQEKGLKLNLDASEINTIYSGDPTRLRQIILNIVSNAIKFTEAGSIDVIISKKPTHKPHTDLILFTIKDTGIGIAADKVDSIFNKFVQADSSINRKYGGTGLGLAITKTLVELMGGSIAVESALGKGSTFKIELTLQRADQENIAEDKKKSPEKLSEKPSENRLKLLLVEDYYPNILVAGAFLEQFGYDYDTASNGLEAIEKFKTGDFKLILMDVQMHGMNGLEATQVIRSYERNNHLAPIPIIGMTAHVLAGDMERCLDAGMNDYIPKPFEPKILKEKIAQLITNNSL